MGEEFGKGWLSVRFLDSPPRGRLDGLARGFSLSGHHPQLQGPYAVALVSPPDTGCAARCRRRGWGALHGPKEA